NPWKIDLILSVVDTGIHASSCRDSKCLQVRKEPASISFSLHGRKPSRRGWISVLTEPQDRVLSESCVESLNLLDRNTVCPGVKTYVLEPSFLNSPGLVDSALG